ncbi:MAG TPA: hypothetical protein VFB39_02325 [Solirubrobacteraceae bacterium]|nr:hypothetical protein [Solirubrobacteraceae bacterium]
MAVSGVGAQTAAAAGSGGVPAPGTGVLAKPALGTPNFSVNDPTEQVRQLAECGTTMYAVGSFSKIYQGSSTFARQNVFSFSATAPFTMTSWAPNVNGIVNSIAFNSDCSDAYIGGQFTSVNGTAVKNIAEISTSTGNVVQSFAHNASAQVETLQAVNSPANGPHLLVGGYYKTINGSSATPGAPTYDPYMTSLDPATGTDDQFVHLNISGHYQYSGVSSNSTRIYNQALSNGGTLDLVMGDFTSVGGKSRQQIFELNVGGSSATVTGWTSSEFNGHCATTEPFYVQAASWSPGDSNIYIATTGRQPPGTKLPGGLCDAAVAFPASPQAVSHTWINYTGCDSLFSTAADDSAHNGSTAYFAGHERWSMNPNGCNGQGAGAYTASGLEGLQPSTGALYVNPKNKASAYYERSRGLGADDMLVTSAGLWIASDNLGNSQTCGNTSGLSGICFLPYGS